MSVCMEAVILHPTAVSAGLYASCVGLYASWVGALRLHVVGVLVLHVCVRSTYFLLFV